MGDAPETWATTPSGDLAFRVIDERSVLNDVRPEGVLTESVTEITPDTFQVYFKTASGTYTVSFAYSLYASCTRHFICDAEGNLVCGFIRGSPATGLNDGYIAVSIDGGRSWVNVIVPKQDPAASVSYLALSAFQSFVYVVWTETSRMFIVGGQMVTDLQRIYAAKFDPVTLEFSSVTDITPNIGVMKIGPNTLRHFDYTSGNGTSTSAIKAGGYDGSAVSSYVETFSGSAWSAASALPYAVFLNACAGNRSGAVVAGGVNSSFYYTSNSAKFNGTSWSSTGSLSSARAYIHASGTSSAAITLCGDTGSGGTNVCQTYNGSAWSSIASYPSSLYRVGVAGTPSSALGVGGYNAAASQHVSYVYKYNGSAWSAVSSFLYPACVQVGGTSNSAVSLTEFDDYYLYSDVIRYNGTTWQAVTGSIIYTCFAVGGYSGAGNDGILADGMIDIPCTTMLFVDGCAPYDISTQIRSDGTLYVLSSSLTTNLFRIIVSPDMSNSWEWITTDACSLADSYHGYFRYPSIDFDQSGNDWVVFHITEPLPTGFGYDVRAISKSLGLKEEISHTSAGAALGISMNAARPAHVVVDRDGTPHTVFCDTQFGVNDVHTNLIYSKRTASGSWSLERVYDWPDHVTSLPLGGVYISDAQTGQFQLVYEEGSSTPRVIVVYPESEFNDVNGNTGETRRIVYQVRGIDGTWSPPETLYTNINYWCSQCHSLHTAAPIVGDLHRGTPQSGSAFVFGREINTALPGKGGVEDPDWGKGQIMFMSVPATVPGRLGSSVLKHTEYLNKRRGFINRTHISTGGWSTHVS